jgi:nucleotide-binding universal stress UspA family protein
MSVLRAPRAARRSNKAVSGSTRPSRSAKKAATRVLLPETAPKAPTEPLHIWSIPSVGCSRWKSVYSTCRRLSLCSSAGGSRAAIFSGSSNSRGHKALRTARSRLDRAGIQYEYSVAVGPVAETIVKYAKRWQCDSILIGTRGLGLTAGLVLGSVALKVIHLAKIPVTLVN